MTLVLRRKQFVQGRYGVVWTQEDGTEHEAGWIYYREASSTHPRSGWRWEVNAEHRPDREAPHEGVAASLKQAEAAFRRCWESGTVLLD
jgi:hypothetical protein